MKVSIVGRLRSVALVIGLCTLLFIGAIFSLRASTEDQHLQTPLLTLVQMTDIDSDYIIVPSAMQLAGDVTVCGDVITDTTVASWCSGAPTGTIMLGVDPSSSDPNDWDGGQAIASIHIDGVVSPTVAVLSVSWPDQEGKGLHSPEPYRIGAITLDGWRLWDKRTTEMSTFNHYYAAEYKPILTTIVLTQSITHTLSFSVPAHTMWDLSQIKLGTYPYPTTVRGIGYGALRDCQVPGGELQPSSQDIKEDLFRLFHTTNAIRTYSAAGTDAQVVTQANAIGLPVFAGAWIDYPTTTMEADQSQVQALIDLACTTDLEGAIVGNEYYLRREHTPDDINYLLERIQQVKTGIDGCGQDLPVTTAEIDGLMFDWDGWDDLDPEINSNYRPILDEVDFIMVHIYPFWNGMPIDGAAAFTTNRYKAIQTLIEQEYPGQSKRVIIGEGGWPSAGAPRADAVPSLWNQRRYMLEFLHLAEQQDVDYLYFSAFDGLWKVEEPGGVGRHWGYGYGDRLAKHNFYSLLIPSKELFSHRVFLPHIVRESTSTTSYLSADLTTHPLSQNAVQAISNISFPFPVYTEWLEGKFAPSGWMGDTDNIDMYECDRTYPHSCEMSIRVSFSPTGTNGWAGVYWQHPANNWGALEGGHDLTGASRLTFWVRGKQGGEVVEFLVGGLGAPTDSFSDTIQPARSTGSIMLSDAWQQIEINLADADLSRVIGGFAWVAGGCHNSEPIKFYLDDIVFDSDPSPDPLPPPTRGPFYVYENDGSGCNHFTPSGWMGDIGDISLSQAWTNDPYRGTTAISVTYSAQGSDGQGWAGVYWQHPENNWGTLEGGYDLTGANRLTFWARGKQGGEVVEFLVGGLGGSEDPYPDTIQPARSSGLVVLSDIWEQHEISLADADAGRVIGGFAWVASRFYNNESITFYLDDIVYQFAQSNR